MRHFFGKKSSREVARDRLRILLISDRVNCSPEMMELIKTDIAKVISKYMKIDTANMDIQISKMGIQGKKGMRNPVLSASIPILDLNKQT
ncbi:MAG: cell division topological specificity factor MinE [bacterium]|nr:cell division topological specificity factor MinE [bacterium]MCM1376604.1 cell division topological specificity factor MinE [Muribaculum sp.]